MAETNLEVVISATDRFTGTANRVIGTLGRMDSAAGRVGKGVGQLGVGLARIAVVGATAAVGGLVAVAKAGLDFQDAMSGVSKTVEGTPAQIAEIGKQLLGISTTIPVTAGNLAAIAQELGALGVPREDIANTARVVAELSAATVGLTPEAAAEAFGKLGNVLSVHGADVERFGSSLVALGNAGASSEGDIIETAKRFGAAGSVAGLSAAQVLGFSSAIASLGVEPEAAGSALSRLFNRVTKYIGTGDDKIKVFAATTGMSVKKFTKLFATDASGAMELFFQKLGKLDKFQIAKILKDAGISNIRDINSVLLLSKHYDELHRQIGLSTDAWQKNTDLQETAAKRFDNVKSKLAIFANTLKAGAITMAYEFLPALGRSIVKLTDFLKLPSTQNDLKRLGAEIGEALDGINWEQVADGARTFTGLLKDAATLISKIPPQIDAAVVAFMGLNKISGGMLGAGIGNIAGGLGQGLLRGVATKIPGVGSLFAQPVYVTNWPAGGIGGGGSSIPGAGGLGVPTLATLGSAGAALAIALIPVAAAEAVMALRGHDQMAADDYRSRLATVAARGGDPMRANIPYLRGAPGTQSLARPIVRLDPRNLSEGNREIVDRVANARDRIESARIAINSLRSTTANGADRIVAAIHAQGKFPQVISVGDLGDRHHVSVPTRRTVLHSVTASSGLTNPVRM